MGLDYCPLILSKNRTKSVSLLAADAIFYHNLFRVDTYSYIWISEGCGIRKCLIVEPFTLGLNGPFAPKGTAIAASSGT